MPNGGNSHDRRKHRRHILRRLLDLGGPPMPPGLYSGAFVGVDLAEAGRSFTIIVRVMGEAAEGSWSIAPYEHQRDNLARAEENLARAEEPNFNWHMDVDGERVADVSPFYYEDDAYRPDTPEDIRELQSGYYGDAMRVKGDEVEEPFMLEDFMSEIDDALDAHERQKEEHSGEMDSKTA